MRRRMAESAGRTTQTSAAWLVPDEPKARMTLEAAAARVQADGVAAEVDFQRHRLGGAAAAEAILAAVRERRPDLVVVSTHARSGLARWRHGSLADQIVRGADVPVLLVPSAVERPWPVDRALRILVPLDGSPLAEEILDPIGRLAEQLGAEPLLLPAVEPLPVGVRSKAPHAARSSQAGGLNRARGYLARIVDRVRRVGMVVSARAGVGQPATAIAVAAREADVDVIAMATRGRGGLKRLLMGSVAVATPRRPASPCCWCGRAWPGERWRRQAWSHTRLPWKASHRRVRHCSSVPRIRAEGIAPPDPWHQRTTGTRRNAQMSRGFSLLVMVWPRGVREDALVLDAWLKDVAPSTELRRWFGHDPARWQEFCQRYAAELDARPDAWAPIVRAVRSGTVTLLYSSHDTEHNNAVALKAYLEARPSETDQTRRREAP